MILFPHHVLTPLWYVCPRFWVLSQEKWSVRNTLDTMIQYSTSTPVEPQVQLKIQKNLFKTCFRSSQGSSNQALSLLVRQLLSLLHGSNLWRRHPLLGAAHVPLRCSRVSRGHHHWGQHYGHQEEVLCHQVLGGLCQEQCHCEYQDKLCYFEGNSTKVFSLVCNLPSKFFLKRFLWIKKYFLVWSVYRRDSSVPLLQPGQQVGESAQDEDDVRERVETSDLGAVHLQVQHQADQWVLRINRGKLQLWKL